MCSFIVSTRRQICYRVNAFYLPGYSFFVYNQFLSGASAMLIGIKWGNNFNRRNDNILAHLLMFFILLPFDLQGTGRLLINSKQCCQSENERYEISAGIAFCRLLFYQAGLLKTERSAVARRQRPQ